MGALKVLYKEILGNEIPSCKNGCLGVIQPGNQSIRTVLGTGFFFFSVCKGSTGYRVFWYRWKEKILEKMRKRPQGGEKKRKKTCAKKKARGMMKRLEKSTVMAQLTKALDLQTQGVS